VRSTDFTWAKRLSIGDTSLPPMVSRET
jgi:hypothetical protein